MADPDGTSVDWIAYNRARSELGPDFARILGYFREDGAKALDAIEEAMRHGTAAALILPAHTLKGDAAQLGGTLLAERAELIEMTARRCVEHHESPEELLETVVQLRPLFDATVASFDAATRVAPVRRPTGFGRKVVFGRA